MKSVKTCFLIAISVFILASCNNNKVFEDYHKFDNYKWNRVNGSVFFETTIEDSSCNYDFIVAVRYIDGIPLEKIEIGFSIYYPNRAELYDEFIIPLKDENGELRGKVALDIWDLQETVISNMPLSATGNYKFEIDNLTGNKYDTPGIMEVGLLIKKSEE